MTTTAKDALIEAIVAFIGGGDLLDRDEVRTALEREIDRDGPESLIELMAHLSVDHGWAYYPPDPLARRIHHLLATRFLTVDSRIEGLEHVSTIGADPVIVVANHLSYADANVIEILLQRSKGAATDLANRLTALAGPKVFTNRERRFSSLCFGTIKVPQSADVSSDEAVLNAREVARAARRAIDVAHERLAAGDALVLFGEGTRSRDRRLQRLLPAVARYLEGPGVWILPVGLTGPEALFPIDGSRLRPTRIIMNVGPAVRSEVLLARVAGNRRHATDAIGLALAALVAPAYRGAYGDAAEFSDARATFAEIFNKP